MNQVEDDKKKGTESMGKKVDPLKAYLEWLQLYVTKFTCGDAPKGMC